MDPHSLEKFQQSPAYQVAFRKAGRLKPVKGEISNETALEILLLHFVGHWDIDRIMKYYLPAKGADKTLVSKICAHNNGDEAARRHDVRRIFAEFAQVFGYGHHVLPEMGIMKKKAYEIPAYKDNPPGLHQRYQVKKNYGEDDPNAVYFVLRLDSGGDDPVWIECCRDAMVMLLGSLLRQGHLPILTADITRMLKTLRTEDPVDGRKRKTSGGRKTGKGTDGTAGGTATAYVGGPAGIDPGETTKAGGRKSKGKDKQG